MLLLVRLTVRSDAAGEFRTYERRSLAILRRHGGELLHALRSAETGETFEETHLIRMPSQEALDRYRSDPALLALRELRSRSITATSLTPVEDASPLYAPPEVTIRPAAPEDAAGIARVHVESWRTTYRGIVPDSYLDSLDIAERTEFRARALERNDPAQATLVAETEEEGIIGFAAAGPARNDVEGSLEVYAIYLLDGWQGTGIGRRLLVDVVGLLSFAEPRRLVIRVLAGNPACRFYEAMGGEAEAESMLELGGATLSMVTYVWPRGIVEEGG